LTASDKCFYRNAKFDYIEAPGSAQLFLEFEFLHARDKLGGTTTMKRYGSVIGVKPEAIEDYRRHHAGVWCEVLEMIRKCNIRNCSIFLKDELLFAYFEYHGADFQADMAKMAADPKTQEWWKITAPMQLPLKSRAKGEWWATMDEVFHLD